MLLLLHACPSPTESQGFCTTVPAIRIRPGEVHINLRLNLKKKKICLCRMIKNKRPFKKHYQDFESIKNVLAPLLSIVHCPGVFLELLHDVLAPG